MSQFHEILQDYLNTYNITQKQLSNQTGISASTLNRYVTGARKPVYDSPQIHALADGIAALSDVENQDFLSKEIRNTFNQTLDESPIIDYDRFLSNTNQLLEMLNIKYSELARATSYDPSHISKILSGSRRPGDLVQFIEKVATFAAQKSQSESIPLKEWIDLQESNSASDLRNQLIEWLSQGNPLPTNHPVSHFLETLDNFDFNEYIRAIHFDEMKVPSNVFYLKTNKTYYGLTKMMESELDFLKTTVLSKSMEDCILYSDMPMEQMAKDPEFPKKWMYGMGMMLKKGLHLHLIHNVNRPFPEMMLGLESHIPMYMTGQISPYYLPNIQNDTFMHLLKVSGAAALVGNAIAGHHEAGKYELYRSHEDVEHYKIRAKDLLKKARPLMDIYTVEKKDIWNAKLMTLMNNERVRMVCSTLPIFTLTDKLLDEILNHSETSEDQKEEIRTYHKTYIDTMRSFLEKGYMLHLVLPSLSKEEFEKYPLHLPVSDLFIEQQIDYTYDQYLENMNDIQKHARDWNNFTLEIRGNYTFRNINYSIISNKMVIVSKETSPAIHFVIHHKKMVDAFQSFIPPITDFKKV